MTLQRLSRALWLPITLLAVSLPGFAAEAPAIEPEADALLKRMSETLGKLKQLEVQVTSSEQKVMNTGLKLTFYREAGATLQRPNHLRAHRRGLVRDQEFVYDGKQFAFYGKTAGLYAIVDAPGDIDALLDFAVDDLGMYLPGRDLFYSDVYAGLIHDIESGYYVGKVPMNGGVCHHLVFRGAEVDWQIWIQDGDQALPCRYTITSKWITGAPEYSIDFKRWDTSPELGPDTFRFTPPEGARKVDADDPQLQPQEG